MTKRKLDLFEVYRRRGPAGGDSAGGDPAGGYPAGGDPAGGDPAGGDPAGAGPGNAGAFYAAPPHSAAHPPRGGAADGFAVPKSAPTNGYSAPKPMSADGYSAPKSGVPADAGGAPKAGAATNTSGSSGGSNPDFAEFYTRLAGKLRSYGVTSIPSYSELYTLFSGFLRPAIDAAIAGRRYRAGVNSAELDADAYSRGMGGSSYLSSVKQRESSAAESDIAALEGKYSASMAEYLYKAISAMQQLESDMAKTRMQIAAQKQLAYARLSAAAHASGGKGGKTGKSGRSSGKSDGGSHYGHNSKGAYFDGKWYDGDFSYLKKKYGYTDYAGYLSTLSASERYLFFNSSSREWRIRRWQVQYNLPEADYNDLMAAFMPTGGGGGQHYPGGGGKWTTMKF
ncbi:MAG: hypothetical protein IKS43_01180 [Clostridia bacterium]|nr:hypothetical protein [Clostridia bacterium]